MKRKLHKNISFAFTDDFSIDETMTEDEKEEKSFSIILPSKSHRNRYNKHHHSDNESVTSEGKFRY